MLPISREQLEACAHAGYEAVRTFCLYNHNHKIGPWSRVPMLVRREIMLDAASYVTGKHPDLVHQEFYERLTADGWTYGSEINREAKKHPRLLPWEQLLPQQRAQEVVFAGIVMVMVRAFGIDSKKIALKPGEEPPRFSVLDHLEWMDQ